MIMPDLIAVVIRLLEITDELDQKLSLLEQTKADNIEQIHQLTFEKDKLTACLAHLDTCLSPD